MMYSSRSRTGFVSSAVAESRRDRIEIQPVPSAVRHARRWTAGVLALADPPRSDELIDSAILAVSELVTNAIHAVSSAGPRAIPLRPAPGRRGAGTIPGTACVSLVITSFRDRVRIEVHDNACAALPAARRGGTDEETGRGLTVITALAAGWGWQPSPLGKMVWCEIVG